MNLFKLSLIEENYKGHKWDAYWGFIIAAETSQEARKIANGDLKQFYDEFSGGEQNFDLESGKSIYRGNYKNNIWLKPKYTKIQKIGIASKGIKKGVVLADFHAG